MTEFVITKTLKKDFIEHLKSQKNPDLLSNYFFFIGDMLDIHPVIFPKEKKIYRSVDAVIKSLDDENKLCHETEILIHYGQEDVNDETTTIYICPFTGKVFGDNTSVNPQDAIYDWVSKCPENKERIGGLRVKRFLFSDDPELIKSYISDNVKTVKKTVYSSVVSGKLFHNKKAVIADFKKNYLKDISLEDVQSQKRFDIEESFLEILQEYVDEDAITEFVEALAEHDEFVPYVTQWAEVDEDEEEE